MSPYMLIKKKTHISTQTHINQITNTSKSINAYMSIWINHDCTQQLIQISKSNQYIYSIQNFMKITRLNLWQLHCPFWIPTLRHSLLIHTNTSSSSPLYIHITSTSPCFKFVFAFYLIPLHTQARLQPLCSLLYSKCSCQ